MIEMNSATVAASVSPASIFSFPGVNFPAFETKFASITAKCRKFGLVAPTFTLLDPTEDDLKVGNCRIAIKGLTSFVIVNGWEVIAKLEHTGAGNEIMNFSGEELAIGWRTAKSDCAHCNHNRVRYCTYLLKSESGEIKQVGSTCLSDFVGVDILPRMAIREELGDMLDDCLSGGGSNGIVLLDYLAIVAEIVKNYGFVKRDGDLPTAQRAYGAYGARNANERIIPSAESKEIAKSAIAHVLASTDDSEYMHNLRIVCRKSVIEFRQMGLVASLIPSYQRTIAPKPDMSKSTHLGTIKGKLTIQLTVNRVLSFEGAYGVTLIHLMTDQAGNSLVWKSSGVRLPEGEMITIMGTVKSHDEYKGIKQTALTRCKRLDVAKVATA